MDEVKHLNTPTQQRFLTHTVENQPPPLAPYDVFATDTALREALHREGAGWAEAEIAKFGLVAGDVLMQLGIAANDNKPRFKPFDRYGHRIDEVEFHPAYHEIMRLCIAHGVPNFAWRHTEIPGANVARAALMYQAAQPEQGTNCPLTMTYAAVPTLRHSPQLAAQWLPRILSTEYDGRFIPAWDKRGNTIGMGMTEKQGGSDVRANTTQAHALGDGLYELVGHKWFFSAPMCDAFLVLAKIDTMGEAGLSCFLLPRHAPDGSLNAIRIQRLKDKLGDWSNASSEVEFHGAVGWLIGEPGRGVATILEMVALTRQDCLIGSAGLMRQALVQALHHTRHRSAFGKRLAEQPLMRNVLADLALESEAAMTLALRVARAIDAAPRDPREAAFARLATAIGKYWVCKRAPAFVNEAQECLGGVGYVEETPLPRLYRQAPLNSIWEGSGNIQCLDVLRALSREPETREAYFTELAEVRGQHPLLDAEAGHIAAALDERDTLELRARSLVERMALALQAALLLRTGVRAVADSFCESRLGGAHGLVFGTLPPGTPMERLMARALP